MTRGGETTRGSRGCEKAGETGCPGVEERAGGQHPRSPPHRSILCPPPCTGESTLSLSYNRRVPYVSSLSSPTTPLRTPVAHGRCRVSRAHFASLLSLSFSPTHPLSLALIFAFSLKGKCARARARGCALILSRPSRTMLEHGPSPPRGISLGGRDPGTA